MSRVHPPERIESSNRPEHPPVWVRGGPATYYYSPNKPQVATTGDEGARRASTSTIDSTTTTEARSPSFSSPFPPTTTTSTSPTSSDFPAPFPTMAGTNTNTQSRTGRSASTSSTEGTSRATNQTQNQRQTRAGSGSGAGFLSGLFSSGGQPMEHPAAAAGRRGSPSSGRPPFSGLRTQKRESPDPTYVQRRESWREQTFKPNENRRYMGRWWDNYIRGDRDSK